eukprot:14087247-Ditylum_brightwellii.AAC.1
MRHLTGKMSSSTLPFVDIPNIPQFWATLSIILLKAKGTPMTIPPRSHFTAHLLNTQVATVFKM